MDSTPWDEINELFFDKIEEDPDFFDYYNLDEQDCLELAMRRADSCLKEACVELALRTNSTINFCDYDKELRQFNFEATPVEKELISSLQLQHYMERDIAKLKVWNNNFTPTDLQVFDPSSGRRTFMQMYQNVVAENDVKIDGYNARERGDNSIAYIDYASFDES